MKKFMFVAFGLSIAFFAMGQTSAQADHCRSGYGYGAGYGYGSGYGNYYGNSYHGAHYAPVYPAVRNYGYGGYGYSHGHNHGYSNRYYSGYGYRNSLNIRRPGFYLGIGR